VVDVESEKKNGLGVSLLSRCDDEMLDRLSASKAAVVLAENEARVLCLQNKLARLKSGLLDEESERKRKDEREKKKPEFRLKRVGAKSSGYWGNSFIESSDCGLETNFY